MWMLLINYEYFVVGDHIDGGDGDEGFVTATAYIIVVV
jgi:hypothetical protein